MSKLLRMAGFAAVCVVIALFASGCIRRMAVITSDPPAAKVWVNGVYRGQTPVEVPYEWNWYYEIKLEKPGYETKVARERFNAAPQHTIPLDLAVEALPVRSCENQSRHYVLTPAREL